MPWQITVDVSKAIPLFSRLEGQSITTIPIRAFTAAGVELQLSARAAAPIRTGNLRSSIQVGPASAEGVEVEAGAEYAGYVEFGTRYMSSRPYMRPSIPRAVQALVDTASREIQRAIRG